MLKFRKDGPKGAKWWIRKRLDSFRFDEDLKMTYYATRTKTFYIAPETGRLVQFTLLLGSGPEGADDLCFHT